MTNLIEILPSNLIVTAHGLPEQLLQPLQRTLVKASLGPGIRDVGDEFHNLIRGHLIYRVHINQAVQFVQDLRIISRGGQLISDRLAVARRIESWLIPTTNTHPLDVPYLAELIERDQFLAANDVRHRFHLFREIHLLFIAAFDGDWCAVKVRK